MEAEAFPRGKVAGATAPADAPSKKAVDGDRLFGGKKRPVVDGGADEEGKGAPRGRAASKGADARKRTKSETSKGPPAAAGHGRADELSAKRIRPGITVLARVRRVAAKQLVLSLPSGMTGYCRLQDINEVVAKAVSKAEGGAEGDEGEEESDSGALASYFSVGQYVAATVLRVEGDAASSTPAALVQNLVGASGDKHRKVYVTLRPEVLNSGTTVSQLRPGSCLSAYIRSVEDHGYAVTTGVEGTTSFLPFSACDGTAGQAGTKLNKEAPGCPVWVTVSGYTKSAGTVTLACKAEAVAGAVAREATHTIHTIKPGALVEATIDKVLPNGLAVTFLGFFSATISLSHLPLPAHAMWAAEPAYTPGSPLRARILYVDTLEKAIALSTAPHMVDLGHTAPSPLPGLGVGGPSFSAADGSVLEACTVLRVDAKMGMLVGWGEAEVPQPKGKGVLVMDKVERSVRAAAVWGRTGYVHISRVADGARVETIEKLYKVGAAVRVRVIGFAGLEGIATLSAKPSVVNAAVLRASDLKPGDIVEGFVSEVMLDRAGDPKAGDRAAGAAAGKGLIARIRLGEGVVGNISALHIADILPSRAMGGAKTRAKQLESSGLVPGGKVKVRVLVAEPGTGKILLTLKRTMVTSTSPALTSFEVAADLLKSSGSAPLLSHGFVTAVKESGLIVTFYGNVHGLVPTSELVAAGLVPVEKATKTRVEAGETDYGQYTAPVPVIQAAFSVGQVVKTRVTRVQPAKGRITLSLALQGTKPGGGEGSRGGVAEAAGPAPALSSLPGPGSLVAGTILKRVEGKEGKEAHLVVKVDTVDGATVLYAALPSSQLSDHQGHAEALLACLEPGTVVHHLAVLAHTPAAVTAAGNAADSRRPLLTLSAKPLLLTAAARGGAMLPSSLRAMVSGALVAGHVASVTVNGAFIRFAGGLTGLAPRSKWPKSAPTDGASSHEYTSGQSVLAVVDKVTAPEEGATGGAGTGRFTLSLLPDAIAKAVSAAYATSKSASVDASLPGAVTCWDGGATSPPCAPAAAFLRGLLLEQEVVLSAAPLKHEGAGDDEEEDESIGEGAKGGVKEEDEEGPVVAVPSRFVYRPGSRLVGTILSANAKGAIIELPPPQPGALPGKGGDLAAQAVSLPAVMAFGVLPEGTSKEAAAAYTPGSKVTVTVLDVDIQQDMVQVLVEGKAAAASKGASAPAAGKKRKMSTEEGPVDAPTLAAPLVSATTAAAVKAAGLGVGILTAVKVVQHRKDAPFAIVSCEGGLFGFLALRDFGGDEAVVVKAGQTLQALVTQLPSKQETPAGEVSMGEAATSAVNSLLLLTAAPFLLSAVAEKPAKGAAAAKGPRSSDAGTASGPQRAVSQLIPGSLVTAILRLAEKDRAQSGRARANSKASGLGSDDEEEGEEEEEGGSRAARTTRHAQPIRAHLLGVVGKHSARISFAECADFDPYSGAAVGGEAHATALQRFNKLLASAERSRVQAKVVAISVRKIQGEAMSHGAKRARAGSAGGGERSAAMAVEGEEAGPDAVFEIELTLRPSDLALPDGSLASLRPSWSSDARVVSRLTALRPAVPSVAPSPAGLLTAVHAADAESLASAGAAAPSPLARGCTGWAVVEGLTTDGAHLTLSLGGGVKARCALLEAGNDDAVRDASTGALHATAATAKALSARAIFKTHPLGSVVPFVILSLDAGKRQAEVSIRRSIGALAVASAAVAAVPVGNKKGKAGDAEASTGFSPAAVAAVASWLPSGDMPAPLPGRVCLGLVQLHERTPPAPVDAGSDGRLDGKAQLSESAFAALPTLPATSQQVHVRLGGAGAGGIHGVVDICHTADKEAWGSSPAARLRQSDVVCAVVLPASCSAPGTRVHADSSLRPSYIAAAVQARAGASTAVAAPLPADKAGAGKRKSGTAAAPAAALGPDAAATSALTALETAELASILLQDAKVDGFIVSAGPKGGFVRVARGVTAKVTMSRLAEHFIKDAGASFPIAKLVRGVVVSADVPSRRLEMSLRKSDVEPGKSGKGGKAGAEKLVGYGALVPGQLFSGRVRAVAEFGVFVALDGTDKNASGGTGDGPAPGGCGKAQPISGLVHVSEVDEAGEEEAATTGKKKGGKAGKGAPPLRGNLSTRFSPGDLVQVVIVTVTPADKKLSLSMRPSRIADAMAAAGQGAGEGEEEEEDDSMDEDAEGNGEDGEDDDEAMGDDDGEEEGDEEGDEELDDDEEEDEGEDEEEDEEEQPAVKTSSSAKPAKSSAPGIFSALTRGDESEEEDEEEEPRLKSKAGKAAPALLAKGGFGWNSALVRRGGAAEASSRAAPGEESDEDMEGGYDDGEAEDGEEASTSAGASKGAKSSARRASKRAATEAEAETRRMEARLASGDAERNPTTVEDFERLVTARPHAPETWIRYMAWQLSVTEVDGARGVAERGLKAVPPTDEEARQALWTAFLNLEAKYGDTASLGKVFARAQSSAEPKAMHMALLGVYERAGESKGTEVEALFGITAKKFGKVDPEVWARWAHFRMRRGDAAGARALLDTGRKNLPPAQHGPLVVKFALTEYRFSLPPGADALEGGGEGHLGKGAGLGSQERGRTLFESLLTAAPRRLDLWSVYLDQEVSAYTKRYAGGARTAGTAGRKGGAAGASAAEDLKAIRTLFERLVSGKHSSKKMKFLLKKFASFERSHGDAAGLARVQAVAQAYVAQQVALATRAGGGGEDEDEDME